jgi:hypothetical protein
LLPSSTIKTRTGGARRIIKKEYGGEAGSLPMGKRRFPMLLALLVKPPPSYSLRVAQFLFLRIIAGDVDWNKANDCDCSINMFISLFTYIS